MNVRILAGQLAYLFEDEPDLRNASDEDLATRLNRSDRYARARETYPMHTDAEVEAKIGDFDDRITPAMVREARAQIPK
jgi:hypothetical protein